MSNTATATATVTQQLDLMVETCKSDLKHLVWVIYRSDKVYVRMAGRLTKRSLGGGWSLDASTDPMDLILKEIAFDADAVVEVQSQSIYLGIL